MKELTSMNPAPPGVTRELVRRTTMRKTMWRILPFLLFAYLVCYLDRVNISFASLEMNADVGISDSAYGIGAGVFFVAYFIFEVPSNIALTKFGPRLWIARIMITWGIIAGCMSLVQGPISFYVLRFLMGVAEAGFFPAMILYLTRWFPREKRAQATATFFMAVPLAGLIGSPLSTWLMTMLHGVAGLRGWQAMFVIEAVPSVLGGIACLFWLVDKPAQATFLTEPERAWLVAELESETGEVSATHRHQHSTMRTLLRPAVLYMALIYLGLEFGEYALGFFLPQMVQSFSDQFGTHLSLMQIGLISAIPSAVGVCCMIFWGRHSDRAQERTWHIVIPTLIGAAAIAASPFFSNFFIGMVLVSVTAAAIYSSIPVFWQLPSRYLVGTAAAVGVAVINSVGNLSGIIAPSLTGVLKDATGTYSAGYILLGVFLLFAAGGTLALHRATHRAPSSEPVTSVPRASQTEV
ncbi:MFS transporter [Streptomyces sp. MK37H]|uniref:MFS transporter n=1 Tax=Streptomyces sp. MK37H TaxID=2699117 RepID=UPI001B37DEF1|nr:MFS transporter [Streptomyces sp. MK37H]MBP8532290.1 MFS transporter [Streptomyces sp. MK37H]